MSNVIPLHREVAEQYSVEFMQEAIRNIRSRRGSSL